MCLKLLTKWLTNARHTHRSYLGVKPWQHQGDPGRSGEPHGVLSAQRLWGARLGPGFFEHSGQIGRLVPLKIAVAKPMQQDYRGLPCKGFDPILIDVNCLGEGSQRLWKCFPFRGFLHPMHLAVEEFYFDSFVPTVWHSNSSALKQCCFQTVLYPQRCIETVLHSNCFVSTVLHWNSSAFKLLCFPKLCIETILHSNCYVFQKFCIETVLHSNCYVFQSFALKEFCSQTVMFKVLRWTNCSLSKGFCQYILYMSVNVQTWHQNKCQKTLLQTYCITRPCMKFIF